MALPANGGFYFQAFNESVVLPVAGYEQQWLDLADRAAKLTKAYRGKEPDHRLVSPTLGGHRSRIGRLSADLLGARIPSIISVSGCRTPGTRSSRRALATRRVLLAENHTPVGAVERPPSGDAALQGPAYSMLARGPWAAHRAWPHGQVDRLQLGIFLHKHWNKNDELRLNEPSVAYRTCAASVLPPSPRSPRPGPRPSFRGLILWGLLSLS